MQFFFSAVWRRGRTDEPRQRVQLQGRRLTEGRPRGQRLCRFSHTKTPRPPSKQRCRLRRPRKTQTTGKVPRHRQSAATLLKTLHTLLCLQEREEREEIEKELRAQQEQQAAALTAAAAQMFGGRAAVGAPGSADTNGRSGH